MIQLNTESFRSGFAFFEHLDLQWREIGHGGVDSNGVGARSNIKRGPLSLSGTKLPFTPPTNPWSENNRS
jgi:hypothetical protein